MMRRLRVASSSSQALRQPRQGIALLMVLLVLMALFVLCAPFLATVSTADSSAARMTERSTLRIALDTAGRRAKGRLGASHSGVDRTPYYDGLGEFDVDNLFPPGFDDANDTGGVMWDLDVEDDSGRVDLNSVSPFMLGNLLGGVSWIASPVKESAKSITLTRFEGFQEQGFVWLGKELISYNELDGNELKQLTRGLSAVEPDEDGNSDPCGPQPADAHPRGALVLDQRLLAIPEWRMRTADGEFQRFSTIEDVLSSEAFILADEFPAKDVMALRRVGSVYGHVRAGVTWARPVRVRSAIVSGEGSCRLTVEETRGFNPGTTIRITDGEATEYGIVRSVRGGRVELMDPLVNDYIAYSAEIAALQRRPVNVNTAPKEVLRALFLNLKLLGSTDRVTSGEANRLVEDVLDKRPFDGHGDLLERLLLPAAGLRVPKADPIDGASAGSNNPEEQVGYLDAKDAIAIYKNGLNANDVELEFSTMPYSFTSRDVYRIDVRASVNAPSGIQRLQGARSEVHVIVPQVRLMEFYARQKDFDDAQLLARNAPGWATGPVVTRRYDIQSNSPTESRAHLGPYDPSLGQADAAAQANTPFYRNAQAGAEEGWVEPAPATLALPSREDEVAWTQLAPLRADEENTQGGSGWNRAGKMMHFDHEARSLEGHYLPDETYSFAPDDPMLDWVDDNGFAKPVYGSMWIKPRSLSSGEMFFDLGGSISDSDRISLLIDEGDLVLRVYDGAGDHPETAFEEIAEVRYSISETGPGLPLDTWSHIEFEVRGNRPDQMTLLVDGKWNNETPGLTRLAAGIGPSDSAIVVESTEGFPDRCVLRIGDELIEATKVSDTAFTADFATEGESTGFGGRVARELFTNEADGPVNFGTSKALAYGPGTPVELYGYSHVFDQNQYVPTQTATLSSELGAFSVLYATGVLINGGVEIEASMEPITFTNPFGDIINAGFGMRAENSDVTGLVLESADLDRSTEEAMKTFSPQGGYAMLVGAGPPENIRNDLTESRFGFIELIRYSGWSGNQLLIDGRGDTVAEELGVVTSQDSLFGTSSSWCIHWAGTIDGEDPNLDITGQVMVIPISVPAAGASMSPGLGFMTADPGGVGSQFAQLTHLGAEAGQTEWVRYDTIVNGHLVRTHPDAFYAVYRSSRGGRGDSTGTLDNIPPSGGGATPGSGTPGSGGVIPGTHDPIGGFQGQALLLVEPPAASNSLVVSSSVSSAAAALAAAPGDADATPGATWDYRWGTSEDEDLLVTRAVGSAFQFRGVLGTSSHTHAAGTLITPVFQIRRSNGLQGGWPGRFDRIMLMEASAGGGGTAPGWPATVHRAVRPTIPYLGFRFESAGDGALGTVARESTWTLNQDWVHDLDLEEGVELVGYGVEPDHFDANFIYVALEAAPSVPIGEAGGLQYEVRSHARMTKFPSGERPRIVGGARLGGSVAGDGSVTATTVDEVVWGTSKFGAAGTEDAAAGAQMILEGNLGEADMSGFIAQKGYRCVGSDFQINGGDVLSDVPQDAGVFRMGDELMVYSSAIASSGAFTIAAGGRGVLGTLPQPHSDNETVTCLEFIRVSRLVAPLNASSWELSLVDSDGFPYEGTVLIDDEIIHYTRRRGNTLDMPRRSEVPGKKDRKADGLFRGRFGTFARDHAVGTPVFFFNARYWDRWTDESDAPELFFNQVTIDQPGAFWTGAFFEVEESGIGGTRLVALARTDPNVPWDTAPFKSGGIRLLEKGMPGGETNPLNVASDRLDLRFYVEYLRGAYDPVDGTSHGWKTTPRLRLFGAEYLAPSQVLRRVDR